MDVTVRIFFSFKSKLETEGNEVEISLSDGSTVREAIEELTDLYPDLKGEILRKGGEPRRFIQVRLNGEGVEHLSGLGTELASGDELLILPKLGGG